MGNNLAQMWDTRFDPRIKAKKSTLTWIVDELYFPDYEKFLQLFENYDKSHKDYGMDICITKKIWRIQWI